MKLKFIVETAGDSAVGIGDYETVVTVDSEMDFEGEDLKEAIEEIKESLQSVFAGETRAEAYLAADE